MLAEIESLDVGKPFAQAAGFDVPFASQTLRYYADLSVHTRRREPIAVSHHEVYTLRVPYGVCAFIVPWNFPFTLLSWGVSPALAAGNVAVVKPAEDTPLSAIYFCHLARQAGVPDGVINVIPGYGETAGAALAAHPGNPAHVVYGFARGGPERGRRLWRESGSGEAGTGRQGGSGVVRGH